MSSREEVFARADEVVWRSRPGGDLDLVLDVTATRDLSDLQLKDEDELAFAVEVGLVFEAAARRTHAIARAAAEDLDHRRWPFDEAAWPTAMPPELLAPATLPDRWDAT